jgi:Zn-dependent peptidase ImmA (M78 family)
LSATQTITYDEQVSFQQEAQLDAEGILRSIWGGYIFPVDPIQIARKLGISVVDAHLAGDVAGAIVKEDGKDPVILLNEADHPNRKRFTAAHEIGHFIRRSDDSFEYVDRRDTLSTMGTNPDEIYANAFAANLLMPESEVRRLHDERVSDLEMALRFGVSRDAMNVRLSSLGLKPH